MLRVPLCLLVVVSAYAIPASVGWASTFHAQQPEQVAPSKRLLPSDSELEESKAKIRERFKEQYADTSKKAKSELAAALLDLVPKVADNPTDQYALIHEALSLHIDAVDPLAVRSTLQMLEDTWAVDGVGLRSSTLITLAPRIRKKTSGVFLDDAIFVLNRVVSEERWTDGQAVIRATHKLLRKYGSAEQKASYSRLRLTTESGVEFVEAQAALVESPEDEAAHQAVGLYLCFVKGDFESGLPHLKKGKDRDLVGCALQDYFQPTDPDKRLAVAKLWSAWASNQAEPERTGAKLRALYWYELVLPELKGLDREEHAQEADRLRAELSSNPMPTEEFELPHRTRRASAKNRRVGRAVDQAVGWLVEHQKEDGSWDADEFSKVCSPDVTSDDDGACWGSGEGNCDTGVTALALLALMAQENGPDSGDVDGAIERGIEWLLEEQDTNSGLIGAGVGHNVAYQHAIASLTLIRAKSIGVDLELEDAIRLAVAQIEERRNPYVAWRYDSNDGKNDTSVTAWMIQALAAAQTLGFEVEAECFKGALSWVDDMSDEGTGRVGYLDKGGASASGSDDWFVDFPEQETEAMTASGLLIRVLSGQVPTDTPLMVQHADRFLKQLPSSKKGSISSRDFYYWYHASEALYLCKSKLPTHWRKWSKALDSALLDLQEQKGHAKGSFAPRTRWGITGGRVYSTSLAVLALTAAWR